MPNQVIQLDFVRSGLLGDLLVFTPEAILILTIALLLLLRLFPSLDRWHLGFVALIANLVAVLVSSIQWLSFPLGTAQPARDLFSGMLVFDGLSAFSRMLILGASSLTILLTVLTKVPDQEDSADFHVLLLGGTLGMCLMVSAQHFVMVYLAIEMASVPSYVLAGFLRGKRQSGEAALKYVVYGGAASGMLLYGISLLAGRLGTGYLPDVCYSLHALMHSGGLDGLYWMCIAFILLGLAFKLSLVPMHFWCPDVFEGAAAEVGAYLAVVSKGAALALMGRIILLLMGGVPGISVTSSHAWTHIAPSLSIAMAVVAGVTCTWGNLAAYPQTNLKRFWAYSTIAHAGYLLMPLATLTRDGLAASLLYLVPYLFMSIGVFAVVCFVRNATHREDLPVMSGLIKRAPTQAIALAIFIVGLVGIPPFAGFLGKYEVFACLYQQAQRQDRLVLLMLLGVGVINTVIALGYYGKLLKIALLDAPEEGTRMPISFRQNLFILALSVFIVVGIFFWDLLTMSGTQIAVRGFQPVP